MLSCYSRSIFAHLILFLLNLFCLHFRIFSIELKKHTGAHCHALLQRIFPTQGSSPRLLSSCIAGRIFTTSTTWEDPYHLSTWIYIILRFSDFMYSRIFYFLILHFLFIVFTVSLSGMYYWECELGLGRNPEYSML